VSSRCAAEAAELVSTERVERHAAVGLEDRRDDATGRAMATPVRARGGDLERDEILGRGRAASARELHADERRADDGPGERRSNDARGTRHALPSLPPQRPTRRADEQSRRSERCRARTSNLLLVGNESPGITGINGLPVLERKHDRPSARPGQLSRDPGMQTGWEPSRDQRLHRTDRLALSAPVLDKRRRIGA